MNSLVFLLIVLAVIAAAIALIVWGGAFASRPKTTRRERELETELDAVRELAYQYRDVDQGLAEAIIDRIAKFNRKELS